MRIFKKFEALMRLNQNTRVRIFKSFEALMRVNQNIRVRIFKKFEALMRKIIIICRQEHSNKGWNL